MADEEPSSRLELSGLCATCNFSGTCMYLRHLGPPIWQCEEFDVFTPRARQPELLPSEPQAAAQNDMPGLCANCDHVATCRLPKTPGGVWHCEEYG